MEESNKIMPLSGIRVLDLGRVIAGPYASQILADYGADVIKIERPTEGDDARASQMGCLLDDKGEKILSETSILILANRNKRSIEVDLTSERGKEIIRRLVEGCDVVVENFTPGVAGRLGVDYETLKKFNPRLIYCSVSGYGQTGPYRMRPGYDLMLQGATGIMSVTGQPDGQPGAGPVRVGASIIDVATGMNGALAILVALRHRDLTGEGQSIDVSLFDTGVALQADNVQKFLLSGDKIGRHGCEQYGAGPARAFACADGSVLVIAGSPRSFADFCDVLGCPEFVEDKRFASNLDRYANRTALAALIEERTRNWKAKDLVEALSAARVPAAPVNDYEQVFEDPHTQARELAIHADHPLSDRLWLIGSPMKLSAAPPKYGRPPLLGEHTEEILAEIGLE